MSTEIVYESVSQQQRQELIHWFEAAPQDQQKVALMTYVGIVHQMIAILDEQSKLFNNGKCELTELGKGVEAGQEQVQSDTRGEADL